MFPKESLIKIGFTEKEAAIYLKLLELKTASANELSLETGIPRVSVYDLTENMHKKGFISEIEQNAKKYFIPTDPLIIYEKTKNELNSFKTAIPFLVDLTKKGLKHPKIRFFEGIESFKKIYDDTLTEKNYTLYSYVDTSKVPQNFLPFLSKYMKKRVKNKISAKVICPFSHRAIWYKSLDESGLKETKLINNKWFELFTEFQIYGDKISIVDYGENKIGLIIEDKYIATSMRNIFLLLWETLDIHK